MRGEVTFCVSYREGPSWTADAVDKAHFVLDAHVYCSNQSQGQVALGLLPKWAVLDTYYTWWHLVVSIESCEKIGPKDSIGLSLLLPASSGPVVQVLFCFSLNSKFAAFHRIYCLTLWPLFSHWVKLREGKTSVPVSAWQFLFPFPVWLCDCEQHLNHCQHHQLPLLELTSSEWSVRLSFLPIF